MRKVDSGFFLTIEGGEGTGKSTLVTSLYNYLVDVEKRVVVKTFEPGDTPFGKRIRELVLHQEDILITSRAELFLYLSDRAHHVESLIKPALNQDLIVICDRFNDSSLAYQGAARRDSEVDKLKEVCDFAAFGLVPDLTLYLDVDPKIALARLKRGKDRLEKEDLEFHQRVRQGYLNIAKEEPDRVYVIDASKSQEEVYKKGLEKVLSSIKVGVRGAFSTDPYLA